MINVKDQEFISELGKRANNEDNYGLIKGSTYVVCDGVGGAEKGEVASEIVVSSFIHAYKSAPSTPIEQVMEQAQQRLSAYLNEHPESVGMATTLTFSHITPKGLQVAWVGDSRVYQFRNGRIVYVTQDHSWVNEALKAGMITAEEAIDHPKSNIITRAVQGMHKPVSAETVILTDVQKGDYILHCSDGVLESWSDQDLSALFGSASGCKEIIDRIKQECQKDSKDNFTAIVYQIDEGHTVTQQKTSVPNSFSTPKPAKKNNIWKVLFGISILVILGLLAMLFMPMKEEPITNQPKEKPPVKMDTTPVKPRVDTVRTTNDTSSQRISNIDPTEPRKDSLSQRQKEKPTKPSVPLNKPGTKPANHSATI